MPVIRPIAPIALVASLMLVGCGSDPSPAEGPTEEGEVMAMPTPPAEPAPLPPEPAIVPDAPPPEISADQQVLDDADASGMTARVDRSAEDLAYDEPAIPANEQ